MLDVRHHHQLRPAPEGRVVLSERVVRDDREIAGVELGRSARWCRDVDVEGAGGRQHLVRSHEVRALGAGVACHNDGGIQGRIVGRPGGQRLVQRGGRLAAPGFDRPCDADPADQQRRQDHREYQHQRRHESADEGRNTERGEAPHPGWRNGLIGHRRSPWRSATLPAGADRQHLFSVRPDRPTPSGTATPTPSPRS